MFDFTAFAKATILLGVSWFLLGLSAAAYPINDLSLYEKVYVSGVLSQKPMTILDIDKANNRVKVAGEDGFAKWVPASRIKSKFEKTAERGNQIVGTALITQCVFQYENCDSAKLGRMIYDKEYKIGDPFPAKGGGFAVKKGERAKPIEPAADFSYNPLPKPAPKPAPQLDSKYSLAPIKPLDVPEGELNSANGKSSIFIENRCHETVTVSDIAIKTPLVTRRPSFFEEIIIQPGERRLVSVNSHTQFHNATKLYVVAKSANFAWESVKPHTLDGRSNTFRELNPFQEKRGTRVSGLTCTKG